MNRFRKAYWCVVAFVATVAIGCTSSADQSHSISVSDRSLAQQELQDLSSFERRVLIDKYVTAAELADATDLLVECFKENGIRAAYVDLNIIGPSGVVSEFVANSTVEVEILAAKESDCRANVSAVEAVWVLQNELDEQERLRAMEIFGECIRQAGIDSPETAAFDEVVGIAIDEYDRLEDAESPIAKNLQSCLTEIVAALTTSLPGLREELAQLDTSTWRLE